MHVRSIAQGQKARGGSQVQFAEQQKQKLHETLMLLVCDCYIQYIKSLPKVLGTPIDYCIISDNIDFFIHVE